MSKNQVKELVEAGVHFGHLTRKWNPNMSPYIYMERNGIHRMKFVRFIINQEDLGKPIEECKGKWVNVTRETLR